MDLFALTAIIEAINKDPAKVLMLLVSNALFGDGSVSDRDILRAAGIDVPRNNPGRTFTINHTQVFISETDIKVMDILSLNSEYVSAIKHLRSITNPSLSLRDAKELVDTYWPNCRRKF